LAETDFAIFDAEFATKQFSGNHVLLTQILGKFISQHQDFDTVLTELIQQGNMETSAHHVHTLKGVSGNLGMTALYNACKTFEEHLASNVSQESLNDLVEVFRQTMIAVNNFSAPDAPQVSENDGLPKSEKAALIAALKSNEFISDSKMQGYLQSMSLDNETQAQLLQAINDLDYPKAIQLLE
jgi:HPt (histidine-containing phosphotransfer) domain-containing protein